MAKLIVIVGMGGSGKTSLCRQIESERKAIPFSDATLNCGRRRAGYDCLPEIVARLLGRNEDCVMDESHLTVPEFRKDFKEFCDSFLSGVEQEWIFFENDLLSCINNVCGDSDRSDESSRFESMLRQSESYVLPEPGSFPGYQKPRKVHPSSNPRFVDKEEALAWLRTKIESLKKKRCR